MKSKIASHGPQARKALTRLSPYVPGKPVEEVKRELKLRKIVKLASNENALGASPKALKAIRKELAHIHEYPEGGCHELRKALCQKLKVQEEEIVFGAGSDEIIHLIGLAFLSPAAEVITCSPSFVIYSTTAALFGARLSLVPLKNYTFDLDGILERVTPRTKVIFIANPNNPTGTIVRRKEIEKFLKKLPPSVLVVLDEAYSEYVNDPAYPHGQDYIYTYPVVVLRTFSKIYGLAGLRIGYGVGCKEIIAHLEKVREPFNVNRLAQAGAKEALADEEHVEKSRQLVLREKERMTFALTRLGCRVIPSQANFLYMETPCPASFLFEVLLQKGVIIRSGDIFGHPACIRVTVGTPEENDLFLQALSVSLKEVRK